MLKHPRIQTGFTLIELIVVVVILGILAAFTIPKFLEIGTEARIAELDGLAGSLRSAAVLAHSIQLADKTNPQTITLEGDTVEMVNGYPAATTKGISETQNPSQPAGFTMVVNPGVAVEFKLDDSPDPQQCKVTYKPATATTAPSVMITTEGCD